MRKKIKIILFTFLLSFIAFLVFAYFVVSGKIVFGKQPKIVANFVNLDKIKQISKFRSCQGHVVVPADQSETKRNMKHYFWQKVEYDNTNDNVEIYAPFDGYISGWRPSESNENNANLWISTFPLPFGRWSFSVDHIAILNDLKRGDKVKAGQLIGYADFSGNHNSVDFIYARLKLPTTKIDNWQSPYAELDSIFNHMSDEVLTQYLKKGVVSKDQTIILKEDRDAKPCVYKGAGPYFLNDPGEIDFDWVKLSN